MKKFLLLMLSLIVSVGVSAEKRQMDLSNLGTGWGSSYEASTKTITFESAWQGRGWWFGTGASAFDASKYSQFVLEIEPTTFTVTVQVVYGTKKKDKPEENESTSANVPAGGSKIVVTLDETMKNNIEQVYVQSDAAGSVILRDAYFYREGPNFHHVTINYDNAIRKEWLVPYYDIDNNATAEVVVNHAAEINGWGIGKMHSWDSNVQDRDIKANSNETYSTFVYTLSELIEFAGESDGFEFNFWETKEVIPTIASITLSLNQITIPLTSAGIGSMILPFAAAIPQGMKVYAFDSYDGNDVLKMKSVEAIEANTPYIIKGEAKDYEFVGVAEADNFQYTVENLTGTYEEIKAPVGSFVLQNKNGNVGFYPVKEGTAPTVKPYHAYLDIPASVSSIYLFFDGEETVIDAIQSELQISDDAIYNVSGQRVSSTYSGLVIKNGKKYIVK